MNLTEQRQILQMILGDQERARTAAIATIVATRGSTYRRAGARLLVDSDGPILGNLSGGCLEGEMTVEAERVIRDRTPALLTYDLSADDEAVWGWGLGCNGVMDVFIEPAEAWQNAAAPVARALEEGRSVAIATTVASESGELLGSHTVVTPDGRIVASSGSGEWDSRLVEPARHLLAQRHNDLVTVDDAKIFIETLTPPDVVAIFGAGHDAIPVGQLCSDLGFQVVVVDDREGLLNEQRFPGADAFLDPASIEVLQHRYPEADRHAIVMTHNYLRDLAILESLPRVEWTYVGLLGPRRRFERLRHDLNEKNGLPEDFLMALHTPAGLDVGAEGPEEIAVAIVAELLAVRNARQGGFLCDRKSPIHEA